MSNEIEVRVSASAQFDVRFKINGASGEIIDATASRILIVQPNMEMDFYELATEVFNAFGVTGADRASIARRMLRFRDALNGAPKREEFLRGRIEAGEQAIPGLLDSAFMHFVLRMLAYSPDGLTMEEIAGTWLAEHQLWFGDENTAAVESLGQQLLQPVLESLLNRQGEWQLALVERVVPANGAPRWFCATPLGRRSRAVIVPPLLLEYFPKLDEMPERGSLAFMVPGYCRFFLSTPRAAEESLARRFGRGQSREATPASDSDASEAYR